ncbi:hypothetical protein HHI36_020105 [Cryptolaemus montrouzieri]|uniref:Uncharacterized protein n=1 Tax=Cryptolaemus montrouzieri TaxID=559131 RepID=A0ABD2N987_9CUCU
MKVRMKVAKGRRKLREGVALKNYGRTKVQVKGLKNRAGDMRERSVKIKAMESERKSASGNSEWKLRKEEDREKCGMKLVQFYEVVSEKNAEINNGRNVWKEISGRKCR